MKKAANGPVSRRSVGDYVIFGILTILMLIIAVPFWNTIVISFETSAAYTRNPAAMFPGEITLKNYQFLFKDNVIWYGYRSTLYVAIVGLIYGMVLMVTMSYAFSQSFPGKRFFFLLVLFTMFFGGGTIPTYLLMKNLGLVNSLNGIVMMGGVSTFNIIIMKNGFENTPRELSEAATIDGANELHIFFHVMLPLQKPLLATFSLFTLVGYWNSWYWPQLLLTDPQKRTLQIVLRTIINTASANSSDSATAAGTNMETFSNGVKMAAVMVTMAPIMCVYPFLQKHFTKGILVGAVKM